METAELEQLDVATTALVLIDFQRGVVDNVYGASFAPRAAAEAVANARRVALALRERGGLVVLVRGTMGLSGPPTLAPMADIMYPDMGKVPEHFAEVVPELADFTENLVTKAHWGSFYGTDLEAHLHRRGIRTLLLGGVATNLGVESAARDAYDRGFTQIIIEDAMTAFDGQAHHDSIERVMRLLGRVRSTEQVLAALPSA